jgi:hypothetical protein
MVPRQVFSDYHRRAMQITDRLNRSSRSTIAPNLNILLYLCCRVEVAG